MASATPETFAHSTVGIVTTGFATLSNLSIAIDSLQRLIRSFQVRHGAHLEFWK